MKNFLKRIVSRFRSIPLPVRIGGGVLLVAGLYVWAFVVPTNAQFSYAATETCVDRVTLAPGIHKQRAGTEEFNVKLTDTFDIMGVSVFSRSACLTPNNAPTEGRIMASVAPFGLPVFSKVFGIDTPAMPTAKIANLVNTEVSAVRPLLVPFSSKDMVYKYTLQQGEKKAECQSVDAGVSCAISQLGLKPSTDYDLALYRGYEENEPLKLEIIPVRTLTAVQLVDATIKNDATVYDKPTELRFTFDRELDAAKAALRRVDGDQANIKVTVMVEGRVAIVVPAEPLPRNASYQLTIEEASGADGGSLADPIAVPFKVSGGPKVTGVSISGANVPQNAQITVTFDQPLKADADIAKFAKLTGVGASVRRTSDTTLTYTIASAPLCAAFSLVVSKGLPSGSNDELAAEDWKFDSRVICGSSATIGSSVKGRAIIAYTFGSGASTILFTGGIHGTEPSSVSTMQAWVAYLQTNAYNIPAGKKIVVVPNTNPDAIAAGTRNNANNVNIARNFPAASWRPDIDTAAGLLPTGGGTSAGSEPETKALMALTRQLRPILEVSFHAQGRLVGANQVGNSTTVGAAYARTVGYTTMFGNAEEVMGYSITGEYEEWMGQDMGIPAILIELPRLSGNYLTSQLTALMNLLNV